MVPFRLPVEETLTIEKLVYGGEGLARQEGKVVLIPFVLPGEVVRAETERSKNDLWRGRVIEILQPSPARIAPSCPYFERCGGCQYQHMDYAVQLEQKRAILREVLQRVGKIAFGCSSMRKTARSDISASIHAIWSQLIIALSLRRSSMRRLPRWIPVRPPLPSSSSPMKQMYR